MAHFLGTISLFSAFPSPHSTPNLRSSALPFPLIRRFLSKLPSFYQLPSFTIHPHEIKGRRNRVTGVVNSSNYYSFHSIVLRKRLKRDPCFINANRLSSFHFLSEFFFQEAELDRTVQKKYLRCAVILFNSMKFPFLRIL